MPGARRHPEALCRLPPRGEAALILAIGVLFLHVLLSCAAAAEPKRILLLHSFGREFAPFSDFSGRFREELVGQSREPVDLYEASVEMARFATSQDEEPLLGYLGALFAGRQLDLIVAVGGPAAGFVQRNRQRLSPSTPVLIAATEQRVIDTAPAIALGATLPVTVDANALIGNILRVLPETTTIAVINGSSPLEKYWASEMQRVLEPYEGGVHFTWLVDLPFDEMLERAAALPPHSAILYLQYWMDKSGVPHEQDRALDELHARATTPIFSYLDAYLGRGIVGGPLLSMQVYSRRAAQAAIRVLAGESLIDIRPTPTGLGLPIFDWRELQRWSISEARLPPGSIVAFREPGAWVRYRWPIVAVSVALLVQGAVIAWLIFERHRRQRAELESRKRLLQAAHLNRSAAAGALSASVAHELNQPLGAILSNAEAAEMLLDADPPDLAQVKEILSDIRQADQRAGEIIQHMRELLKRRGEIDAKLFDLNDTIADAMRILSPEAKKRGVVLDAEESRTPLPVRADHIHLEQVILNLAANGMDAMAGVEPQERKMTIKTAVNGKAEVEVSIADRGSGIPKDKLEAVFDSFYTTKQQGTGLGLSIARTIVEAYGGRIWAENRAGGGAVFRFTMPLTKVQPA